MRVRPVLPLLLSLLALAACAPSLPDRPPAPRGPERRVVLAVPRFDHFPPYELVAPEAAAPDLDSHPRAREYRTRLREGAAKGPAFAGHLAVASWACGQGCRQWAFVDARDGRVVWGPRTGPTAEFRRDSRLFVADPKDRARTRFYVWTGTALREMEG